MARVHYKPSVPAASLHGPSSLRRRYLEEVANRCGKSLYRLSSDQAFNSREAKILRDYNRSVPMAVMTEFPEIWWKVWEFDKMPRLFIENLLAPAFKEGDAVAVCFVREYIQYLEEKHSITSWTNVSVRRLGPSAISLLNQLGSLHAVLEKLGIAEASIGAKKLQSKPYGYWNNSDNEFQFVESLKVKLGGTMESLYNLNTSMVLEAGGRAILGRHGYSVFKLVTDVYPTHNWKPWKFNKVPLSWWQEVGNGIKNKEQAMCNLVKEYICELEIQLNIPDPNGWYLITKEQLGESHFTHIQQLGGLLKVLDTVYPSHGWSVSRFILSPAASLLNSVSNEPTPTFSHILTQLRQQLTSNSLNEHSLEIIRALQKEIEEEASITTKDQWYDVVVEDLSDNLRRVVESLGGLYVILKAARPHERWEPILFTDAPKELLEQIALTNVDNEQNANVISSIRLLVDHLRNEYRVQELDGFYDLEHRLKCTENGQRMFNKLNALGGLALILWKLFPEHPWKMWRFTESPLEYWSELGKRFVKWEQQAVILVSEYVHHLEDKYGIVQLEDWYSVSEQLSPTDAKYVRRLGRITTVLRRTYPHFSWQPWKFAQSPLSWWSELGAKMTMNDKATLNLLRQWLEDISKKHSIEKLEDWYFISHDQLGDTVLMQLRHLSAGGLPDVLSRVYPHHQWDRNAFHLISDKSQWKLVSTVGTLL